MRRDGWKQVLMWVFSVLLAIAYFLSGLWKLLGSEAVANQFAGWGYAAWFMTLIGLIEVAGAAALLVPRAAPYATVALGVVMLGAAYTHVANGEAAEALRPLIFLAVLAVVFWLRRQQVGPAPAAPQQPAA